jgi:LAO/AO transport system kinase
VLRASALLHEGIDAVWSAIDEHHATLDGAGELAGRRAEQNGQWMWSEITDGLVDLVRSEPATRARVDALEVEVRAGRVSPTAAAQQVLATILGRAAPTG